MGKILVHPTVFHCPVSLAFLQLETRLIAAKTRNPKVVLLRGAARPRKEVKTL